MGIISLHDLSGTPPMRNLHPAALILTGWTLAWTSPPGVRAANPPAVVVEAGAVARVDLPVVVAVDPMVITPGRYHLNDGVGGPGLPAIAYEDAGHTYLGFVLARAEAGSSTRFAVEPASAESPGQGVRFAESGRRVAVTVGGQPWTTYIPDDGPKPYLDPLMGPSGVALTRAWPMRDDVADEPRDHPHHRSMWFAHIDVNKSNTWDEHPGHGAIRETTRPTVVGTGGPVGVLRTTDDWLDKDGKKVCEDERVVRFYATTTARVFDFDVTLKATAGPVRMGDNKDGVFGIRVAAPMALTAKKGGHILNSRGVKDAAAWGQAAEWVDYSGPVAGATRGIAIFNHPESFRYPTTWHVRDYGLFAANPFGWHDFKQPKRGDHDIPPGGSIHLAYRVILHDGDPEAAAIAARFASFEAPPKVTIQP